MLEKSALIEIIIQLLSLLVFVICDFIKDFYHILTSYCKFTMTKALKWGIVCLCILIFQQDIHKML